MSYLGRGLVEFQVEVFVTGTVTAKVLPAVSAYCITTTTTITIHYNTHFGNLSLAAAATSSILWWWEERIMRMQNRVYSPFCQSNIYLYRLFCIACVCVCVHVVCVEFEQYVLVNNV